jgi:capsular exopolysaccharide synthesis family protein
VSLPQFAAALIRQRLTVIGVVVAAFAAVCVVTFTLPTEYEATATLAVGGNRPLTPSANPVEFDQTLARTYSELLQTPAAGTDAARALPFRISPGELARKVSFEAVGGTALLRIRATDRDPRRAPQIANAYAESFVRAQQESLIAAARDAFQRSARRLRALALQISELRNRRDAEAIADLAQARTELAAERDAYKARRESIALQGSNLAVASEARRPQSPARPRPRLYLLVGFVFAVALGVFAGVFRDSLDTRVRSEDELVQLLGAPILGRVPRVARSQERSVPLEEAFLLLRSNIDLHGTGQRLRTLGVTSAARGEGKTLVVAGLAHALARAGARVTAVDCDLRQPALHTWLEVDGSPGLADALVAPSSAGRALQSTESPNLRVLPSGPPPANAAVLLTRERFSRVLDELARSEDYVVCDMPHVTVGPDVAAVSASVDAVVVVVDPGLARRGALLVLRERLQSPGTRVLGIVLNRVKESGRSDAGSDRDPPSSAVAAISRAARPRGRARARAGA